MCLKWSIKQIANFWSFALFKIAAHEKWSEMMNAV